MAASALALLLMGVALGAGAGPGSWLDPDHDPSDFDYDEESKGVCSTMKSPDEEPVLTCCEGWEQVKGAGPATETDFAMPRCRPVCEPACVNATCTYPNECTCLPDYLRSRGSPKHICTPRCQQLCVNAECVGPNMCRCKEGFEPTSTRHVCRKAGSGAQGNWSAVLGPGPPGGWNLCQPPCGDFQTCVGSNCTCKEGFSPDPRTPNSCIPACSPPCGPHAFCLANKVCRCISGYVDDGKRGCVPECEDGCANGRCVAPGECVCNAGYEQFRDDGDVLCVPQCTPPCGVGGECIATNICSCESGHQLSEEGDCVGICPEGTSWNRTLQMCKKPSTTVSPAPTTALPPRPSTTPPTPPPPPPTEVSPPPTQTPSQPCTPPCVHGHCTPAGACECLRGWTGADCARPCELRDGGLRFDARGCPELANCTCAQPAPDGRSCLPGASVDCDKSAVTSPGDGSSGGTEWPKWLWWAVGGGAVVALLLFVVVPSAVALQRRHKKQREDSHERETLQGKKPRRYSPGGGRAHDHDDQWEFMPS